MALDTRGLASGFGQGFGLADQYYARQNQQERQGKADERADRSMEMREEQFGMQMQEAERTQGQRQAEFILGKGAQGIMPNDEEMKFLKENSQYWPAFDPESDAAIENAQKVIDPNDPMDANDPEAIYSMNVLFGGRVNRGEGGKKRIAGMYPGKQEGHVTFDLGVTGDDNTERFQPMTKGRGTEGDDEVLETPVENLVNHVQGIRMMRNAFRSPEGQQMASKMLAALRGDSPKQSEAYRKRNEMVGLGIDEGTATKSAYGLKPDKNERYGDAFEHPQLGWVQPGPNGQLKQMDAAGGPTKGINMNGFLVDSVTGEQMGDFRTPDQRQGKENERYGDAFEHPQLGWVQPGPNGQLKQMDTAGGPTKGINMNGFLVDSVTGEQMGDFRTPDQRQGKENERYGDAFEHPQLGWVQPGPNGQLKQMDTAGGQGEADWRKLNDGSLFNQRTGETRGVGSELPNDGTGGLDSSVMSQIQQTARSFHGTFNSDGSFLGLPAGAREKYTMALQRSEELVGAGLSVFEAANLANMSVGDKLTESDAKRVAEQEAETEVQGWFKGDERNAFVARRAKELMAESAGAEKRYQKLISSKTSNDAPPPQVDAEQAGNIKADYKAGKITREQALSKLRSMGFQ